MDATSFSKPLILSGFLLWLTLAALLVPTSPANAGIRICKYNYTGSNDRQRLRTAMQQVLPAGVSVEGFPSFCRNPGSADAWLETTPRLRADHAVEWWYVSCERRRALEWTCKPSEHRQLIWVYAEVGGLLRRLEVSFDEATGLERARTLSAQAMRIIQDPSSNPLSACGSPLDAQNRSEWEKVQRQSALKPQDNAVELSVESLDNGAVDVSTNDQLTIRFTDGSAGSLSRGVCWTEWIVVG
jgi:hypothetical protein